MPFPISSPLSLAAAILVLGAGQAPSAGAAVGPDKQVVKLQRPMKEGQRFKEVTTATVEQTSLRRERQGVAERNTARYTIHFEADQEVLATTPRGSPKAYRIVFKEMTKTEEGGKKQTIFKPGTVVLGKAGPDGSVFTREADGQELDDEMQGTMADLFGMSHEDDANTMDALYDTDKERLFGERWSINEAVARQWFQQPNDPRTIMGVSGESRLVREVMVDGVKCYQIGHTVSVRQRTNVRWQRLPRSPENHFLSAMLSTLPADNTSMERGYTSMKRYRYIAPDEGGDPMRSNEVVIESHYNTAIKPLSPAPPKAKSEPKDNKTGDHGKDDPEIHPDDQGEEADEGGKAE